MDIIAAIAEELQIKKGQAEAAVKLIDEGNTIYRQIPKGGNRLIK